VIAMRAAVAVLAALLAGCATSPASVPERTITLHYLQGDYVAYRVEADAQGSYAQYRFGKTVYLTAGLSLDEDRLDAFADLAEKSNFYNLPDDLDVLPEPQSPDCDASAEQDPDCTLERIVVTSDCGPDSRLRISDGRRSHEVHWSCGINTGERVIAPLLDAVRSLFADQPTVSNAPPVRGWRR
jgi:hypothetical protein